MKTNPMKYAIFMKLFPIFICLLFFWTGISQNKTEGTYDNPVIAGDFPDPSVIRIGETYYAVGTSNDFAPNYPIYESSDLINWTRISSVFNQPPEWASDDFWAPELFYNNGTYYLYYTTKRKDNRIACIGVATTTDIHAGFTDHGIIIEWGEEAIDAYIYKDDDGKLYITWKAYGLTKGREIEILASELSDDGLSLIGNHWTLTDHTKGWIGAGDEGQCLVKRNGYYYLLYSIGGCCDNKCDYRVMVSRSKNLRSGWEQYPDPVLQGGETWRCPGHGTLVTTPEDRDFYMYHSYNAADFEYIGRQGMLDEIIWDKKTNWPYFKNGSTPSVEAATPFKNSTQKKEVNWQEDFTSEKSLSFWEWDVNVPKPQAKIVSENLILTTSHKGINFLGLRPKAGDYSLTTQVSTSKGNSGIGVYSDQDNALALLVNESSVIIMKVENGARKIVLKENIKIDSPIFLKYECTDGRYYKFYWSENEKEWTALPIDGSNDGFDASFIPQWGYSPRVGFISDGQVEHNANYSFLKIKTLN